MIIYGRLLLNKTEEIKNKILKWTSTSKFRRRKSVEKRENIPTSNFAFDVDSTSNRHWYFDGFYSASKKRQKSWKSWKIDVELSLKFRLFPLGKDPMDIYRKMTPNLNPLNCIREIWRNHLSILAAFICQNILCFHGVSSIKSTYIVALAETYSVLFM